MAKKISFSAQPRDVLGKKVGRLRRKGLVPANISGDLESSVPVMVGVGKFEKIYEQVGDTGLFYLTVDGEKKDRPVLVGDVQRDSITAEPLHVVFRQVDLTEKITAEVPVEMVGEFELKDAVLSLLHDTVEVEALPQDLPEKFALDATKLQAVGDTLTYADLEYDKSVITLMIDEDQISDPIVIIQKVEEEVVEEVSTDADADAPTTDAAAPNATDEAPAVETKE